jgi:hypothetical protein
MAHYITSGPISPDQRHHMVAEAAYFMAEHRGFIGDLSIEDWLVAEQQVDTMLSERDV